MELIKKWDVVETIDLKIRGGGERLEVWHLGPVILGKQEVNFLSFRGFIGFGGKLLPLLGSIMATTRWDLGSI